MTVFEALRTGQSYDIRDADYQREVHGEIDRCNHLCWAISQTDPADKPESNSLKMSCCTVKCKTAHFSRRR